MARIPGGRQQPEMVPGDRRLRTNLLLAVALYVLAGLAIGPLIDWAITRGGAADAVAYARLAEQKRFLATLAYSLWRILPLLVAFWFGYRVFASAKLPPGGMKRFPFTVPRIHGRTATMFGLLLMAAGIMLLYRETLVLLRNALG